MATGPVLRVAAVVFAALKPVLGIVVDGATGDPSMEMAINGTKRIYNEGCDELKEGAK